eukprot:scaffold93429_cov45-Phaeocystis_antarctica.AAC.1
MGGRARWFVPARWAPRSAHGLTPSPGPNPEVDSAPVPCATRYARVRVRVRPGQDSTHDGYTHYLEGGVAGIGGSCMNRGPLQRLARRSPGPGSGPVVSWKGEGGGAHLVHGAGAVGRVQLDLLLGALALAWVRVSVRVRVRVRALAQTGGGTGRLLFEALL